MNRKILCAFLISLFAAFCFSENGYEENFVDELEIETLEAKSKKSLSNEKDTSIKIECNEKNARVFINKNYHGLTDLTVKDLRPGRYKLEVQKKGFKSTVFYIQVKSKLELSYFVLLEELPNQETENTEDNQEN